MNTNLSSTLFSKSLHLGLQALVGSFALSSMTLAQVQPSEQKITELKEQTIQSLSNLESVVDSIPLPAAQSMSDRLAVLPSMRLDTEGRLRWRGTDEFRIDFDQIPLERNLLATFPSGLSADLITDPQPNASVNSGGMTGYIHLNPKRLADHSYTEIQGGLGSPVTQKEFPGRTWYGFQSAYMGQNLKTWVQLHQQNREENREEIWKSPGLIRNLEWIDQEKRLFGLVGASLEGFKQSFELQGWTNLSELSRPYSRTNFNGNIKTYGFDPQDQTELYASHALWKLNTQCIQSSILIDGLHTDLTQDWQTQENTEKRNWMRGKADVGVHWNSATSTSIGVEHSWEGREQNASPLYEEKADALWIMAEHKQAALKGELGFRLENNTRTLLDKSYDKTKTSYLPSAALYYDMPWYSAESYVRLSGRTELPDPSLVIPGKRLISPFEGRIGNPNLKTEEIYGLEFGLGIPVPYWAGKLEVKAFSAMAQNMLMRTWTWEQDTAFLFVENGLSENRRGGEASWTQKFSTSTLKIDAGGWIEDREVVGPKQELVGMTGKINYNQYLGETWDMGGHFGWTGPAFESEGEAEAYFEESILLGYKPIKPLRIELGAEDFFGTDRTLKQDLPLTQGGGTWERKRLSSGPKVWMGLKWNLMAY